MSRAEAPKDTLFCLCMLADWNPVCQRLQPSLEGGAKLLQGQPIKVRGCRGWQVAKPLTHARTPVQCKNP